MAAMTGWRAQLVNKLQVQQEKAQCWSTIFEQYDALRVQYELLAYREHTLTVELQTLLKEHSQNVKELEALRSARDADCTAELQAKTAILESTVSSLQSELTEAYKVKAEQVQRLLTLTDQVHNQAHALSERDVLLDQQQTTIHGLEQTVSQQQATMQEMDSAIEVLGKELGTLKSQHQDLQEKAKLLEEENDALITRWLQRNVELAEQMNELAKQSTTKPKQRFSFSALRKAMQGPTDVATSIGGTHDTPEGSWDKSEVQRHGSLPFLGTRGVQEEAATRSWEKHQPAVQTKYSLRTKLTMTFDEVQSVCFSHDGRLMATGGSDPRACVWDIGGMLRWTLAGATQSVMCTAFCNSDRFLLVGSNDMAVRCYELPTAHLKHTLTGHANKVLSVKGSADGSHAFSGSQDRTIKVWALARGNIERTLFPNSACNSLVLSDDSGTGIISGHSDGHLRVHDARSRQCVNDIGDLHTAAITSVDLSPDRWLVLTNSRDHTLKVVDMRMGMAVLAKYSDQGYQSSSNNAQACFCSNGQSVATGSVDGTVLVWGVASKKVATVLKELTGPVYSCTYSHTSNVLAAGGRGHVVCLWDV